MIPADLLEAYGFTSSHLEPVSGGLINTTYVVKGDDGTAIAALQRLHPVFAPEVNFDIEAISKVLAEHGLPTPRLLRTQSGDAWHQCGQETWRAISWVEGQCFSKLRDPALAENAAELVARFHLALAPLQYKFRFQRSGVHDTAEHLRKLEAARCTSADIGEAEALRIAIARQAAALPAMPSLPQRICHGDLKISNLLFDEEGKGLCLIDLDTMGYQTIAYELGDALRSWGNPTGEDTTSPAIDSAIVEAAARGYARGSQGLLSRDEIDSVIIGLETICLELAARFCLDAFEDNYFGWDSSKYASRRQHNIVRGQGQLALCRSVAKQRDELQTLWSGAFV